MDPARGDKGKYFLCVFAKGVNSVPYWPVQPEYTVSASKLVRITPLFRIGKNTGRTGHILAIPANFGQYRPVSGVSGGTKKSFFFFFLSFVIFEFLLGQNDNLFALTS